MRLNNFFAGATVLSLTLSQVGVNNVEAGLLGKILGLFSFKKEQATDSSQGNNGIKIELKNFNFSNKNDDSNKLNENEKINDDEKKKANVLKGEEKNLIYKDNEINLEINKDFFTKKSEVNTNTENELLKETGNILDLIQDSKEKQLKKYDSDDAKISDNSRVIVRLENNPKFDTGNEFPRSSFYKLGKEEILKDKVKETGNLKFKEYGKIKLSTDYVNSIDKPAKEAIEEKDLKIKGNLTNRKYGVENRETKSGTEITKKKVIFAEGTIGGTEFKKDKTANNLYKKNKAEFEEGSLKIKERFKNEVKEMENSKKKESKRTGLEANTGEKENILPEENIFKIVENYSGETSFIVNYCGKCIVPKGVMKYNEILCWNHNNEKVKKVEKVVNYDDIYVLNGRFDLDIKEDISSLKDEHKKKVSNVISSFIRVSLCKMLCQSRNNNWHEGKVYLVSEESYTKSMVTSLKKLFAVLNVIQKKSKRKSQWLECAETIFLDLHRRIKFTTEQGHCLNRWQLDERIS